MNSRMLAVLAVGCIGVLTWGSAGCGSRSAGTGTSITGKVLYKGQPVAGGDLALHPKSPGGIPYSCKINADGSFSGTLPPGTVGEMTVTVQTSAPQRGGQATFGEEMRQKNKELVAKAIKSSGATLPSFGPVAVPEKYTQKTTSPLTWTITEGPNTKDFELTD
jgi:hypothetical protein